MGVHGFKLAQAATVLLALPLLWPSASEHHGTSPHCLAQTMIWSAKPRHSVCRSFEVGVFGGSVRDPCVPTRERNSETFEDRAVTQALPLLEACPLQVHPAG